MFSQLFQNCCAVTWILVIRILNLPTTTRMWQHGVVGSLVSVGADFEIGKFFQQFGQSQLHTAVVNSLHSSIFCSVLHFPVSSNNVKPGASYVKVFHLLHLLFSLL
jgi:hypothetical protein